MGTSHMRKRGRNKIELTQQRLHYTAYCGYIILIVEQLKRDFIDTKSDTLLSISWAPTQL